MDTVAKAGILTRLLWTGSTHITVVFMITGAVLGGLTASAEEAVQLERDERRQLLETVVKLQLENQALKHRVALLEAGDVRESGQEEELLSKGGLRILNYNPGLKMVILSSGAWHQMKPGMRLAVRRGEKSVAKLVVVDVRERLSGALVENLNEGQVLQVGDEVIRYAADTDVKNGR